MHGKWVCNWVCMIGLEMTCETIGELLSLRLKKIASFPILRR